MFVRELLPSKVQLVMEKIGDIVIILIALVLMIWGGYEVVHLTWNQIAPSTGMSMAAMYSALPVSGVFVIFYSIYNLLDKNELATVKEGEEGGGTA